MSYSKKQTLEAIDESIAHWKRMIRWAKKQPAKSPVSGAVMQVSIGEYWCGDFCSLCALFSTYCGFYYANRQKCPLHAINDPCDNGSSSWRQVNNAYNWGIWCCCATRMLNSLQKARLYVKKQPSA